MLPNPGVPQVVLKGFQRIQLPIAAAGDTAVGVGVAAVTPNGAENEGVAVRQHGAQTRRLFLRFAQNDRRCGASFGQPYNLSF